MAKALHLFDRLSTSLDSVFPALEELSLKDTRPNNIIKDEKLDWEKIARQLPQNLSKLELGVLAPFLPSNFRALLPSSITSLVLETATYLENKEDKYSELLTDLTVQTYHPFYQDDFGAVPASLTRLHIDRPPHLCYPSNTYFRATVSLPTLHQGLKTLKCDIALYSGDFGLLPKTLTALELHACNWSQDDLSNIPQCLQVFKSDLDFNGDDLALLPPTLKILHGNFHVIPPWSKFPPALTELKTHQLCAQRLPTGTIPPHLTTLIWPFDILALDAFSNSNVSSIFCTTENTFTIAKCTPPTCVTSLRFSKIPSSKGLSNLPPYLQTLHIDLGTHFSPDILKNIPKTIRELHIGKDCPALPFSLLRLLPHPLKHFFVHEIAIDDAIMEILPLGTPLEFVSIDFLIHKASNFFLPSHTHLCCSKWSVPGFKDVNFFERMQNVKGLKTLDWTLPQSHNPTIHRGSSGALGEVNKSIFIGCAEAPFEGLTKLVCNLPPYINLSDITEKLETGPLDHLPVNLTDLESDLPIESKRVSKLVHLTRLCLKNYLPTLKFLQQLPQNLSSLRIDKASLTKEDWATLPRTLTSLAIGSFALGRNRDEAPPYEHLPPLITELTFCNSAGERLEGPCTAWLRPITFTTIGSKIPHSFDQWTIANVSRVGTMPETIQKVQLFQLPHMVLDDIFSRLPTSVTLISFPNNCNFTTRSISSWPASLTSIQLGGLLFSKTDISILYNSPGVETNDRMNSIDARQREHLDWNLLTAIILAKGPASLSHIQVKNRGEFNSTDWIDNLPSTLKSIDLETSQISDSDIARLPRSLEVLRFVSCRRLTQRGISMLPDNLTDLALANVQFTELLLPASLTKLELLFCSSLTAKHIEALPSGMLHVLIPAAAFTDETLTKLPQKLISLRLRQINISAYSLRTISTVTLPAIIDCILSSLPTTLQHLDMSEFIFDPEAILSSLPRNVTHVMLPGTSNQIMRSSIFSKELGIVYQRQFNSTNNPLLSVSSTSQSRAQSGPSLAPKSSKPMFSA